MIRASLGDQAYWDKWTRFSEQAVDKVLDAISRPSGNPIYRAQFVWDLSKDYLRLTLRRYSRGDAIFELFQDFPGLLDAWELSDRLSVEICTEHGLKTCRDWDFSLTNLNHYNYCFWLVGLALLLKVPDEQWQRLLALVNGAGEDELLDRVIASRESRRRIGGRLLHPTPYARLLKAIDAPSHEQAALLRDFVDHWYPELKRPVPRRLNAPSDQPYWYSYGDSEKYPLERGSYFGRWCIEAAAAANAFGLDDSFCLGHEHYPGDLLRPDGPSTHKSKPGDVSSVGQGMVARLLSKLRRKSTP
ncbi:MAG: DUF1911 domain-containing protein [Dyella sp.]|nr:DUF1911 domain-containing protein [Dyella sp.]